MSASDQQHRRQGKPVPSLLSLVTGNRPGTWATLHSYLIDHLGAAFPGELGHLVGRLEQPHDHEDYRRLLHSTWCYLGRVRATLQPGFTAESTQSQGVVLGRAVEALRQVKDCKNVLAYGRGYNLKAMASGSWEVLKGRVGDTVMMYLLLNVSLFATLENGCFFQLSGEPVLADARATKRVSVYDGFVGYSSGKGSGGRGRELGAEGRGAESAKKRTGDGAGETGGQTGNVMGNVMGNVKDKKKEKKSRPPKWKRAQYKKRMGTGTGGGDARATDATDAARTTSATPATKNNGANHYGNHFGDNNNKTNNMQSPAEMQVHRHSMFYKQQHAKQCGLPKSHVLMQLGAWEGQGGQGGRGREAGANAGASASGAALYRCIFKPQLNPVARKYNHLKGAPVLCKPKRFPWKNRHVVALLSSMVRRAQSSQGRIGRLLDLHCPMMGDEAAVNGRPGPSRGREGKLGAGKRKRRGDGEEREGDDADDAIDRAGEISKEDMDINIEAPDMTCFKHGVASRSAPAFAPAFAPASAPRAATLPWSSPCFQPVPHRNVSAFIWSVLKRIVPSGLIGGLKAKRVLRRNVTMFVRLKRFESVSVHRLMHKLPIGDLPWLQVSKSGKPYTKLSPSTQAKQIKMAAMWVGWLFGALVVPLLRAHFYCTENESCRQETFYYRKPVWSKMVDKAITDTFGAAFVPVPANVARETLESRNIGVARIRFLPKSGGLRFLMNMSKPTVAKFKERRTEKKNAKTNEWAGLVGAAGDDGAVNGADGNGGTNTANTAKTAKTANNLNNVTDPPAIKTLKFGPINQRLKLTLRVLQCEARRQPEAFGSSTYGFNDIFCRYKPFVRQWKADRMKSLQQGADPADLEPPHAVCVDVSKAFDNVDVETLLGICSDLLTAEKYTILKFTEIMTMMGNVRVNHRSVAVPSHEVQDGHFTQRAAEMANGQKNRIFLDCVTEESITRQHIMQVLRQYLSMNLVWLKNKWRRQSKGIAQGAKPSTLLCSLYLGYVERVCLNPLIASCGGSSHDSHDDNSHNRRRNHACPDPSHSLLLRMVDDWMLISRHKSVVEQFAAKTIEGIPGFNIVVNPAKTQTTVPIELPEIGVSIQPNPIVEADGARFIKWCGLLIDVETLELRADYTRYSGAHVKTTVNIPVARKPGLTLGSKICHYIRPKILAVLLDEEINSRLTVRLNVYQMFVLGAMKAHSFLASLPQPPVPGSSSRYIMAAIDVGIKYMIQSTRPKVILRASANTSSASLNPNLAHAHVEYLALKAFHRTFSIKRSRYKHDLLPLLEERMNSMKRVAKHLDEVVLEDHSGVFRSIKF